MNILARDNYDVPDHAPPLPLSPRARSRAHRRTCTRKSPGWAPVMCSDISEADRGPAVFGALIALMGMRSPCATVPSEGIAEPVSARVCLGTAACHCAYGGVRACVRVRATSAKPCQASGWCPAWGEGAQCHSELSQSVWSAQAGVGARACSYRHCGSHPLGAPRWLRRCLSLSDLWA